MLAHLNFTNGRNPYSIPDSFNLSPNEDEKKEIYLIIRSLKNKDGTPKVIFFVNLREFKFILRDAQLNLEM